MTRIVAAAALAGALLVAPAASAASSSTVLGCGAYEGAVKKELIYWYARVYNACGSAKKMRAVVTAWPDGPCEWVGAYSRADLYAGVQAPSGTADC